MEIDQKSEKMLRGGSFNPSTTPNSALQKGFRRLLHFWESAWESGRRDGLLILLWQILVRCSAPLGSVALLCLYERDLNQAVPEIEPLADIAVTVATESDIELIGAQIAADFEGGSDALPAVHRRIRFRLELGQICFVAKIGSALVHYTWISFHSSPVQDRSIALKDHEAFLAWAYTPEAWRGKHIYPAVNSHVLRLLQTSGYRQVLTFVKVENRSSKTGLERVGWTPVGRFLTLKPFWSERTRIWWLSGKPQTGRFPD